MKECRLTKRDLQVIVLFLITVAFFSGGFPAAQGPGSANSTSRLKHGGAGHGGTGGRGSCDGLVSCISRKGLPYGGMFHPASFGSGGDGAATGGKGGGIIEINTRRLQVIMKSTKF